MIRLWILAFALVGLLVNESEARSRSRNVRYSGRSWSTQSPMRYTNSNSYSVQVPTTPLKATPVTTVTKTSTSPIQQVSHQSSTGLPLSVDPNMQAWAEDEARMMAERGICGHVRGAPIGYFVGVGCGRTCMGSGTLVAEATYQGKTVRVWRR